MEQGRRQHLPQKQGLSCSQYTMYMYSVGNHNSRKLLYKAYIFINHIIQTTNPDGAICYIPAGTSRESISIRKHCRRINEIKRRKIYIEQKLMVTLISYRYCYIVIASSLQLKRLFPNLIVPGIKPHYFCCVTSHGRESKTICSQSISSDAGWLKIKIWLELVNILYNMHSEPSKQQCPRLT